MKHFIRALKILLSVSAVAATSGCVVYDAPYAPPAPRYAYVAPAVPYVYGYNYYRPYGYRGGYGGYGRYGGGGRYWH